MKRYELVVAAAFAVLWVVVATGHPRNPEGQVSLAIAIALLATPSVIATLLLRRALARTRLSTMDGPERLLAAAVAALPDDRHDWGRAMAAELAQVRGRSARWWFAAGCARTAVLGPLADRVGVLMAGVGAVLVVAGAEQAVGLALPAMRVFAVTFVALVGVMVILAMARSGRIRVAAPGPAVVGVVGVTGCIGMIAYFLARHPSAAEALRPGTAVIFAAAMAGCLWLALVPPRALTTSRLARRIGVGAALALAAGLVVASRLPGDREGIAVYLMPAPIVIFFLGSALAAALDRSLRAGIQAAVWTAVLGTAMVAVAYLVEALYWHQIGAGLLLDAENGPRYPVGENLPDAITWTLVFVVVWGLPFGVIGAAVGRRLRPVRSRSRPLPVQRGHQLPS